MKKPDKNEKKVVSAYELAFSLGYMIVVPVVIFGVGGVLLDKRFDSFPLFVFIGFFLAMTSGLLVVYKKTKDIIVMGIPKKKNEEKNKKR